MTTAPARELPTSATYVEHITDLAGRVAAVTRYLGPVLTIDGVRARGWDVTIDPGLPIGRLDVAPGRVTMTVAEPGELTRLLLYAEHHRQAWRALRANVVDVALRAGFTNLRPFVRPVPKESRP